MPALETRKVELPAGTLALEVTRADLPLETLCGFASRANARRGFLFVSRVLGKHIPVRPSQMAEVHAKLAGKIGAALEGVQAGPMLCIALAETATGLGQSVYGHLTLQPPAPSTLSRSVLAQKRHLTGRAALALSLSRSLFLHSTRYRLKSHDTLHFEESHSHASNHLIHIPDGVLEREVFYGAKTLILIDDEMSTGNTFVNLARAYAEVNPALERVVLVTLTDWAGAKRQRALAREMPCQTHLVSLLEGEYAWTPDPGFVLEHTRAAHGDGQPRDALLTRNFGRLGLLENPRVDFEALLERALPVGAIPEGLRSTHASPPRGRVLVLGTGEFAYLPFEFARWLEARGHDVHFQSSTRSPILTGGAIERALEFPDNYLDGIPNYVYNLEPRDYDLILVCAETPLETLAPLLERVKGVPVLF